MSTRRSTRVKQEPIDELLEASTPKRKKKNEEEPGTSKRTAKQMKAVKSEPPEETVSPKRKGRPSTGTEKKKNTVPFNDAQDLKDLTEFRRAKAPKDILTVYDSEPQLLKFLGGAIRAAPNKELTCPGCKKIFTSHSGIAYHIQRCKESVIDWEGVHDSLVYSDVKDRPWMWMNGKKKAKEEMAAAVLKESPGGVSCVRGSACGSSLFTAAPAFIAHLNMCCVPTYNQFRGQIEEFRAMEKKTRTTLVRLGMAANGGQLPCLSCGKFFAHKYGLQYHLERCGFTDDNADSIPWKCYRCGFEGKVCDRETHLDECDVPASEAVKPKKDRLSRTEMDREGLAELSGKRRRSVGVSMASGVIPSGASQTRTTHMGLKRFKFRKSEAMQHNITISADLDRYRTLVTAAIEEHEQANESSSLCEMLQRRANAETTPWERREEGTYVESLREKKSIGLRKRTVDDFAQSEGKINSNSKRTTFPPMVEHPNMPVDALTRIGTFTTETIESPCSPSVSIGYTGGPIAATLLAPTPLDETSECLAVLTFPDDENLIEATTGKAHWRATDAYIQMWKVEKSREEKRKKNMGMDDTREVTRCDLSLWFVLQIEGRGLALAANWMPRSTTEASDIIGYLAVAMSEGSVVIYCIRKESVPVADAGMKEGTVIVVAPPPLLLLRAPSLEQVGEMKRKQRQERKEERGETSNLLGSLGERLTRSGRSQLESIIHEDAQAVAENGANALPVPVTSTVHEMDDVKPIIGFMEDDEMREEEGSQGTEIIRMPTARVPASPQTPLRRTKAEQRKELIKMRLVKPEYGPPPQPPLIAVSWSPFGACNSIAAVDAAGTVIVWELDEKLIVVPSGDDEGKKEKESLLPLRVFVDVDWVSPAINVGWMDGHVLGVSFAERMIRVLDTSTGECQLEENTVRTAGKSLLTMGSCFEGLFIYQSEFYTATEAPETAVVYLAYGADKEGYFVVPLTNRHGLMVWAVGVSSSGVIGTAGADGRLQLSMNGKVVPRGCTQDLSVNLHTDPILLIRNRVTEPRIEVDDDEVEEVNGVKKEKPLPPPVYATHDDITSKMWLDIVCEDADTVSGPALPQGLLDSRVESLNAITLSTHSTASPMDHIVVTGGQAGLLFARSCHIEEKGVGSTSWLNLRKWSNPSSKESTPRPRSRTSKDRTPKEQREPTE